MHVTWPVASAQSLTLISLSIAYLDRKCSPAQPPSPWSPPRPYPTSPPLRPSRSRTTFRPISPPVLSWHHQRAITPCFHHLLRVSLLTWDLSTGPTEVSSSTTTPCCPPSPSALPGRNRLVCSRCLVSACSNYLEQSNSTLTQFNILTSA